MSVYPETPSVFLASTIAGPRRAVCFARSSGAGLRHSVGLRVSCEHCGPSDGPPDVVGNVQGLPELPRLTGGWGGGVLHPNPDTVRQCSAQGVGPHCPGAAWRGHHTGPCQEGTGGGTGDKEA